MLTSENLVKKRYTDHHIVIQDAQTSLGNLRVFSLNILTRQCVVFFNSPLSTEKLVRLNLPLSWFLTHAKYTSAQLLLEQYGRTLKLLVQPHAGVKQQLTLATLDHLPQAQENFTLDNIFLETETEYAGRLRALSEFIGHELIKAQQENYIPIFLLQELPTSLTSLTIFLSDLKNIAPHIACYYETSPKAFMPAILYDSSQLVLQKDRASLALINTVSETFKSIIKDASSSNYIGQFLLAAFKHRKSDQLLLINSAHIDFSIINQDSHHTLELMQKLANLAVQHHMILGGDFNRKINIEELAQLEQFNFVNCKAAFKSTEPGLQLHDTLDGLFIPTL